MNIRKLDNRYRAVAEILGDLTSREIYVIRARLLESDTLKEVGDRLGVSLQMVRLSEQAALKKITEAFRRNKLRVPRKD